MFAVIKIGGNQYKVTPGDQIVVDRVSGNVGDAVSVETLLVAEGESVKIGKEAAAVPVIAHIVDHGKGEKIHIRRFRAKSNYRRHIGFRAYLTTLTIEAIGNTSPVQKTQAKPSKTKSAHKTS